MGFMIGRAPIRRTLKYLNAGKLHLKDNVKIFSVNYNTFGEHHEGAKDFVFWKIPQIQYKNPSVQVVTLKNMTPSPFIRCYFGSGDEIIIDVDSKDKDEIEQHLISVVGKSEKILAAEAKLAEKKDNSANIGVGCSMHCICEVPGQLPCPGVVPLPNHLRGKFTLQQK